MTENHTDYKPQPVITQFSDPYQLHSPNTTVCLVSVDSDNAVSSVRKPEHAPIWTYRHNFTIFYDNWA